MGSANQQKIIEIQKEIESRQHVFQESLRHYEQKRNEALNDVITKYRRIYCYSCWNFDKSISMALKIVDKIYKPSTIEHEKKLAVLHKSLKEAQVPGINKK